MTVELDASGVVHEHDVVDDLVAQREALRREGRAVLGIAQEGKPPKLRAVLNENGLSYHPVTALGVLAVVDSFQAFGFTVLTPEISQSLGISAGMIALLITLKTLAVAIAPLPIAALVQRHPRRALVCIVTAVLWGIATLLTGFVISTFTLLLVLVFDGLTTGSTGALHQPLLMDHYPPQARVRVISTYRAFESFGNVLAPLLVGLLAGVLGFTWRGVFVVFGIVCLLVVLYVLPLRDPGFGRWDTERLREQVGADSGDLDQADVSLGFFEVVRRLLLIPTVRRLLGAFAVFGMLLIPFSTFLSFYLDERLELGPGDRGVFFGFASFCSMVALALYGSRGEAAFRRDPRRLVQRSGEFLVLAVVLIGLGVAVAWTPATVALFGAAMASIALLGPGLWISVLSVAPAQMRPHLAALITIFLGGVGGIAGAVLLGGISSRYGLPGALVSLIVPGVLGGLLLRNAGSGIQADLDRMIDEVVEDQQLRTLKSTGGRLPMLACRGIDFSYGKLQVLFDVDFTVDDGEMVALLGTNGAGKSTLLKVISGLGLPQKGTVRYRGQEITYLDPERRTRLGITQVPGGRAVFGPLTVVENLRTYGYGLGKERRHLDALIEECLDTFPRLGERRNSLASQLSGGEQQMLGLSKALILKPRVLVIDELSLGLAPIIVGQLLEMVRRINNEGTAVVLVEQSVNIALNLVDHAYFMEKGEMRFDGPSQELLQRDDLLRAVFLEGAEAAR
jgi:ABC-type branched-subunit amino acid transport system ATPase component/MFS family permease